MDVTLLEIHLPEAEFNAPFSRGDRDDVDTEPAAPTASAGGGTSPRAPVVALLVLVGLALLARYLRSRGADADADTAA